MQIIRWLCSKCSATDGLREWLTRDLLHTVIRSFKTPLLEALLEIDIFAARASEAEGAVHHVMQQGQPGRVMRSLMTGDAMMGFGHIPSL